MAALSDRGTERREPGGDAGEGEQEPNLERDQLRGYLRGKGNIRELVPTWKQGRNQASSAGVSPSRRKSLLFTGSALPPSIPGRIEFLAMLPLSLVHIGIK